LTDLERQVYDLRQQRTPNAEICRRLQLTESSLSRLITTLREKGLHLPKSQNAPQAQDDELRRLWVEKIHLTEIATRLRISLNSVKASARRLSLPNRRDARAILALLTPKEQKWLHKQATGGLSINEIIAAIVRDAYAEENHGSIGEDGFLKPKKKPKGHCIWYSTLLMANDLRWI
jgi:DNA-binding CsgD family transcriptional regulator